jgi:hypothetical protein
LTVKNLNKRVSREWSKNKGADKKSGSNKSRKNNGKSNDHPKTWPAPNKGDKMGAGGHFIGVVGHQLRQKGKMSKVQIPLGAQDFSPETSKSKMTQTSKSRH